MYKWKVCPVQGRQLKDVRPEDIYGDFRICKTYRSGGGYDQLAKIADKRDVFRYPGSNLEKQFVVQLYGCHLRCPYCYVTKDGIFGEYKEYLSKDLAVSYYKAVQRYNVGVFHLMGGAPALYIHRWPELLDCLAEHTVFHSDLLLTEREYPLDVLDKISKPNTIYAVNIKGTHPDDFEKNTGRSYRIFQSVFNKNFDNIVAAGLNFYLTFTNPDLNYIDEYEEILIKRYGKDVLNDSFIIGVVDYEALEEGDAF